MAKQTKQDVIDRYSLSDKTSVEMDRMIEPKGLRSRTLWIQIKMEKLRTERKAERFAKFQERLQDYTADDLVGINGIVGFDFSEREGS